MVLIIEVIHHSRLDACFALGIRADLPLPPSSGCLIDDEEARHPDHLDG